MSHLIRSFQYFLVNYIVLRVSGYDSFLLTKNSVSDFTHQHYLL